MKNFFFFFWLAEGNSCDNCVYLIYDEDYEEYLCDADMDDYALTSSEG